MLERGALALGDLETGQRPGVGRDLLLRGLGRGEGLARVGLLGLRFLVATTAGRQARRGQRRGDDEGQRGAELCSRRVDAQGNSDQGAEQ